MTFIIFSGERDPNTGRGRQVTFRFYCNPTVPLGSPKFVQQQQYEYVFDFQTSLACSAKAVQCSVTDNKGTKYDLTPLGLSSGIVKLFRISFSKSSSLSFRIFLKRLP